MIQGDAGPVIIVCIVLLGTFLVDECPVLQKIIPRDCLKFVLVQKIIKVTSVYFRLLVKLVIKIQPTRICFEDTIRATSRIKRHTVLTISIDLNSNLPPSHHLLRSTGKVQVIIYGKAALINIVGHT